MIKKCIMLSLPVLGLTTVAVNAGSLSPEISEPKVTIAAPAPTSLGRFYGSLSFAATQPDGNFTQDTNDEYSSGEIDLASGTGFIGAYGYDYGTGMRVELEYARSVGDSDRISFPDAAANAPFDEAVTDGDVAIATGMLNGWFNIGSYGNIQPFIGGGIGVAKGEIDIAFELGSNEVGISDSDTVFAWQIGGGVEYAMSENLSLVASYRYLQANDLDLADAENTPVVADLNAHVVVLGVTMRF